MSFIRSLDSHCPLYFCPSTLMPFVGDELAWGSDPCGTLDHSKLKGDCSHQSCAPQAPSLQHCAVRVSRVGSANPDKAEIRRNPNPYCSLVVVVSGLASHQRLFTSSHLRGKNDFMVGLHWGSILEAYWKMCIYYTVHTHKLQRVLRWESVGSWNAPLRHAVAKCTPDMTPDGIDLTDQEYLTRLWLFWRMCSSSHPHVSLLHSRTSWDTYST